MVEEYHWRWETMVFLSNPTRVRHMQANTCMEWPELVDKYRFTSCYLSMYVLIIVAFRLVAMCLSTKKKGPLARNVWGKQKNDVFRHGVNYMPPIDNSIRYLYWVELWRWDSCKDAESERTSPLSISEPDISRNLAEYNWKSISINATGLSPPEALVELSGTMVKGWPHSSWNCVYSNTLKPMKISIMNVSRRVAKRESSTPS